MSHPAPSGGVVFAVGHINRTIVAQAFFMVGQDLEP